jgi:hypothetical protein
MTTMTTTDRGIESLQFQPTEFEYQAARMIRLSAIAAQEAENTAREYRRHSTPYVSFEGRKTLLWDVVESMLDAGDDAAAVRREAEIRRWPAQAVETCIVWLSPSR